MLSLTSMRDVTATHAARMAKRAGNQDSTTRDFDRADALVAIAEDIVRGNHHHRFVHEYGERAIASPAFRAIADYFGMP